MQNFKTIGPVDFEVWRAQTLRITNFRKTLKVLHTKKIQNKIR